MLAMLMTLAGVVSANAADVTFTLVIDNPDALLVEINYQEQTIVAGANEFTVPEYTTVNVTVIPPYSFRQITDESGIQQNIYGSTWYYTASPYNEGTYTIETYNLDESRTASCTVKVDNASKVNAILSGTNSRVILENGINTVKYDPNTETTLELSAVNYNVPLYSVTVDGEKVNSQGSTFYITLSQDCYVDITADIPDIDVTVTFSYSEKGFGALSSVTVDGTAVSDFDGYTLAMKAGKSLGLVPNSLFNIQSLKINGNNVNWGNFTYTTTVMGDMTVEITAQPYGMVHGTVTVDDASNIKLYRGYSYQNDMISLTNGENPIEVPENNTYISWVAADGCLINSVSVNGTALSEGASGTYVREGDNIVFSTAKIVMDKQAVVWIDDPAAPDSYFSFQGKDYTSVTLEPGYNLIEFYSGMTPFGLSWYSSTAPIVGKIYVDGEQISPMYEGSTSYGLQLDNGSVAKVFLATEPEECTVTFNSAEGVNASVIRDLIVPVTDLNGSFTAFKGTEMTVTPADGEKITVTVNDTEVTAEQDGSYKVTVNDATTLIAIDKDSSDIDNIATDNNVRNADVYNLQGIKVGRASDATTLPAGIYIINGKKVMIK